VELEPKSKVLASLKRASSGRYEKAEDARKILESLTPETVRARAPNCDRFLSYIESVAGA